MRIFYDEIFPMTFKNNMLFSYQISYEVEKFAKKQNLLETSNIATNQYSRTYVLIFKNVIVSQNATVTGQKKIISAIGAHKIQHKFIIIKRNEKNMMK